MTPLSVSLILFVLNLVVVVFLLIRYYTRSYEDILDAERRADRAVDDAREARRDADYWRGRAGHSNEPSA